ncbi:MAG TPA: AAA family ATPase [Planctomycetes bacterium]|nr:AAA family ATPase [Planctomycetota bacterium]
MLRDLLLLQRRELEERLAEPYVERDTAPPGRPHKLITVISGPRRAGKSFFAMHRLRSLGGFGYVNFDDERIEKLEDGDALLAAVSSVYGAPRRLLLDEVQNLPRWELFVNRVQRLGYALTITGSNAHLLSSELATHLTGRHVHIVILPFSFTEYLRSLGTELTSAEQSEHLRRYAETGGFPEPLLTGIGAREYLTTLFRSVIYKDIVVRRKIRSPAGLEDLASHLVSNVAREYSCRSLAAVSRCRSPVTVEKYVRALEEAFLFFSLRRFSFKLREQVRANRKIYCIDNGFVAAMSFRSSGDVGQAYENLVAVALKRRQLEGRAEIYFWKNEAQEEVDFVVKEGRRVTALIQVCVRMESAKTRDRALRALLKASSELKCRTLLVLTDDLEGEETASWFGYRGTIRFVPLWKWFAGGA